MNTLGRERSAVRELAIWFLPSIPALIWLWPNLHDERVLMAVQSAAYAYVLAGVVWIGRRRWSWDQLGVNRRGGWTGVLCGGVLVVLRALEDWRGPAAAVVGSAAGFALWHIGWAGPLMIGHFVVGLYFSLIRRRSQGILGLIAAHGLFDLPSSQLAGPIPIDRILQAITRREVAAPWLLLGDALLAGAVIYLLWVHPRVRSSGRPEGACTERPSPD
jgi:hypothetical protein